MCLFVALCSFVQLLMDQMLVWRSSRFYYLLVSLSSFLFTKYINMILKMAKLLKIIDYGMMVQNNGLLTNTLHLFII